jgi:hypothetical protein
LCKNYLSSVIPGEVMNNIYVMPYKGVWAVKKEAEEEPDSVHETREEALHKAKEHVKDEKHIVVLLADGTIDNPEAYSIEPLLEEKENDDNKRSTTEKDK